MNHPRLKGCDCFVRQTRASALVIARADGQALDTDLDEVIELLAGLLLDLDWERDSHSDTRRELATAQQSAQLTKRQRARHTRRVIAQLDQSCRRGAPSAELVERLRHLMRGVA